MLSVMCLTRLVDLLERRSHLGLVVGGIVSGRLARFYEPLQPAAFWGLHMVLVASGTVLLAMLRRPLARVLKVT